MRNFLFICIKLLSLFLLFSPPLYFTQTNAYNLDKSEELSVKPVAIIYSLTSFKYNPILTHWSLLSVQYNLILAGIPYRIISEYDLLQNNLEDFSCIIFPYNKWMPDNVSRRIVQILPNWIRDGGSLICLGVPSVFNENGEESIFWRDIIEKVFNLEYKGYLTGLYKVAIASEHFITCDYSIGEIVFSESNRTYNYFSLGKNGVKCVPILETINGLIVAAALEVGFGRVAVFSDYGYSELIQRTKLLLRSIQWTIFGNKTPVGIQLTSGRLIWILNIDADWSGYVEGTVEALTKLLKISNEYGFTFSWALITGKYGLFPTSIDWSEVKPFLKHAMDSGVEITSHSVHHPIWKEVKYDREFIRGELIESKKQIEGNLTKIYGFQVPDGMLGPEYYKFAVEAGYSYLIETCAYPYTRMIGFQPINNTLFFVMWRSTLSDYMYFDMEELNPEEALNIEFKNYDEVYDLGHSAPYILLWHDYSIIDDTRRKTFMKVLEYEFSSRPDVVSLTPNELLKRINVLLKLKFSVSYLDNGIEIKLNTENLNNEDLNYLSTMSILIDGEHTVKKVLFLGEKYAAFSNKRIIIPRLSRGTYIFKAFYEGEYELPKLTCISPCLLLKVSTSNENLSIEIGRLVNRNVKITVFYTKEVSEIKSDEKELNWNTIKGGFTIINVDVENSMKIDFFFGEISKPKTKYNVTLILAFLLLVIPIIMYLIWRKTKRI